MITVEQVVAEVQRHYPHTDFYIPMQTLESFNTWSVQCRGGYNFLTDCDFKATGLASPEAALSAYYRHVGESVARLVSGNEIAEDREDEDG